MLTVGRPAPAFTARETTGKTIRLRDLRGQWVVLYFYPKDHTSGCTREACDFRDAYRQFRRWKTAVVGVSPDDARSHEKFIEKFSLPFPLLCDTDKAIAKAYGVYKQKSLYGRSYMGIVRTTFVIDPQGKIAKIFPKVKVDGHVDKVLDALEMR